MRENQPSLTAQRVALRRAAHQLLDDPIVFEDPLALRILGPRDAEAVRADPGRFDTSRLSPYLRAFLAARGRYAEEELALAMKRGVRQYVVLGAGLDTFAYRNPHAGDGLRVFEVDHPATQAWKRERLAEAGIAIPPGLTFVPVDFQAQTLADGLREAGYDPGAGAFFSWLGVTQYLSPDEVMATLRFMANAPAGSGVVFDYFLSRSLLNFIGKKVFDALTSQVAKGGELMTGFFDPAALGNDLRVMGFSRVTDLGQQEINAKYFQGRSDGLGVGSLSRLISAEV